MRKNKNIISFSILLCILFSGIFEILALNSTNTFKEQINQEQIYTSGQESYTRQWIENPNFSSLENWTSYKDVLGDPNDVEAEISGGEANYQVFGDKRTFSLVADPPLDTDWTDLENPAFPFFPDNYEINEKGCDVYHYWNEGADQSPSVHWDQNITMPVNISDYIITSASLRAVVNGTVKADDGDTEGVEAVGDAVQGGTQYATYDYARYYVMLSDLEKNKVYEVAYYQTTSLGQDSAGDMDYLNNTDMFAVPKESLIFFLTSVLNTDNFNFTITLGIRIWCEDNWVNDDDLWESLVINYINLTFTYEKKIDQLTSISWNQDTMRPNDINDISNITIVNNAVLNFKYKINESWTSLSPNSEIQILINGIKHSETINLLEKAETFYQDAKFGGFDLTYLIDEDKNINISIQLYIADNFKLNRSVEISIDDVYLNLSYTIIFDDYQTNLQLFLNGMNKTSSPSITIPIGQNLTITIKYTNQTGHHIPEAGIQLTGVGIIKDLKEFSNNYSITINVTQELNMGDNYLNIEAMKTNFQTKFINPTITVRKINTEIITVSGSPNINIDVGENAQLEVMLNDSDNDKLIKGAIVTYTWDLDLIPRVLTETNGIYEGEIENPPEGLYTITISAFAGDDYEFDDFDITLNVGAHIPSPQPDLSWLIYILGSAILGLVIFFTLYQTHFKYPPMVRKIRKLKKKIKKTKKTKQILVNSREQIIKNTIEEGLKDLNLGIRKLEEIDKNIYKREDDI